MKKKLNRKRNSLAVRLTDEDYNGFLKTTGRQYSETLRALMKAYADNFVDTDMELPLRDRVTTVLGRIE